MCIYIYIYICMHIYIYIYIYIYIPIYGRAVALKVHSAPGFGGNCLSNTTCQHTCSSNVMNNISHIRQGMPQKTNEAALDN